VFLLFFSNLNPLWRIIEHRPRTLDDLNLHGMCIGFLMAALPGSYWRIVECTSGDEITVVKTSEAGEPDFELKVDSADLSDTWSEKFGEIAQLSIGSAGNLCSGVTSGSYTVSCSDPVRIVALIRAAARSLGHDASSRYRRYSEGPNDENAIKNYLDSLR